MKPLQWLVLVLFAPLLLPILFLIGFYFVGRTLVFHSLLLIFWVPRGRRALFVYSNSPNWHDYCEREIVAHLPATAVILNWSERKKWPRTAISTILFRAYTGRGEYNPLGIVFRPFKPMRIFHFWQPFRDAKHGKPQKLERLKEEFLAAARRQD